VGLKHGEATGQEGLTEIIRSVRRGIAAGEGPMVWKEEKQKQSKTMKTI